MSRISQSIKTEGRLVAALSWGGNRATASGQVISSGDDGNVPKLDYDDSCTTL